MLLLLVHLMLSALPQLNSVNYNLSGVIPPDPADTPAPTPSPHRETDFTSFSSSGEHLATTSDMPTEGGKTKLTTKVDNLL